VVINGHKSAAHTDSPDGGTGKTCLGGGMPCPSVLVEVDFSTDGMSFYIAQTIVTSASITLSIVIF